MYIHHSFIVAIVVGSLKYRLLYILRLLPTAAPPLLIKRGDMALEWPRPQPKRDLGILPADTTSGTTRGFHHNDAAWPEENAWRWTWKWQLTTTVPAPTAMTTNQCIAPHPSATKGITPPCQHQVHNRTRSAWVLNTPLMKKVSWVLRIINPPSPPFLCLEYPAANLRDVQSSM